MENFYFFGNIWWRQIKNPAQWHCATSGINNIIFLAKRIIINNWKYMVYKYLFLILYHGGGLAALPKAYFLLKVK